MSRKTGLSLPRAETSRHSRPPDGRQIAFQSGRTTRPEIWRSDADGSDLLQLTSFDNGFSGTPRWSPDGKWIAFDHHHETHGQIYLIDSEGRNMHAVTSGNYENVVPDWSRDGAAVYFASNRTGSMQVWRRELVTGRETQMTHQGGFAVSESSDGKRLYYSRFEGGGIWSMPVGGGEEQRVTDALHKGYWGHFAVTDAGLYLLNSESAPKPMLMFYKFQTHRLTPVLQLEYPNRGWQTSQPRATGGQYSLPRETGIAPSRWRRISSRRHAPILGESRSLREFVDQWEKVAVPPRYEYALRIHAR